MAVETNPFTRAMAASTETKEHADAIAELCDLAWGDASRGDLILSRDTLIRAHYRACRLQFALSEAIAELNQATGR